MPAFDGTRLGVGVGGAKVDFLAFAAVDVHLNRPNRRRNGENIYGAYGSLPDFVAHTKIEPYVFLKTLKQVPATAGQPGPADIYTTGLRWAVNRPSGFEYSVEGMRQGGNRSSDKVSAWYAYGNVGYAFKELRTEPHFRTEYGHATGDDGRTGRYGTFDHLYFGTQGILGTADLFGLQNIKYFRNSVDIQLVDSVKVIIDHHFLWLANKRDGLYAVNGRMTVAPPPGGAASGDVGQELDLIVEYTPTPAVRLAAGFGHLFPGRFVKENSPGSTTSFSYLSATYRF